MVVNYIQNGYSFKFAVGVDENGSVSHEGLLDSGARKFADGPFDFLNLGVG
jgi:hypothetical protein